jgi:NADP-dependent 3-hydroxy acid dehydrogenase YdfG
MVIAMSTTDTTSTTVPTIYPLEGRVAVVTGASSGIGEATARALAAGGARVALLARRRDRLDDLAADLGDDAIAITADVTSGLDAAAEEVTARLGRPDLVVANAGVMLATRFSAQPADDQDRMVDVNVGGVIRTARAFLPALREAAAEGARSDLVTISSVAAHLRFADYAVYCATKAAVTALAQGLRVELGPEGVRVTNIEPGLVESELAGHVTEPAAAEFLEQWRSSVGPIGADQLADVIAYAVSRPAGVSVPQLLVQPTTQG